MAPVPDSPVYYAPEVDSNYFFYDGLYWVYVNDTWYSSSWYDGPWYVAEPAIVPVFVLRVPVRWHATPSRQRGHHLIHGLAIRDRTTCDAKTNVNGRIFLFHFRVCWLSISSIMIIICNS